MRRTSQGATGGGPPKGPPRRSSASAAKTGGPPGSRPSSSGSTAAAAAAAAAALPREAVCRPLLAARKPHKLRKGFAAAEVLPNGHDRSILCLDLHPSKMYCATGSADGGLRVFRLPGAPRGPPGGPPGAPGGSL
ncbi:WD domain, G-beta repeat-containing protein, putative, partial [Eimeria tenella]